MSYWRSLFLVSIVIEVILFNSGCIALLRGKHEPPNLKESRYLRGPTGKKIVVFVHGVLGDSDSTWRNKTSNTYWPQMILDDPDYKEYDVFLVSQRPPAEPVA